MIRKAWVHILIIIVGLTSFDERVLHAAPSWQVPMLILTGVLFDVWSIPVLVGVSLGCVSHTTSVTRRLCITTGSVL